MFTLKQDTYITLSKAQEIPLRRGGKGREKGCETMFSDGLEIGTEIMNLQQP